MTPLEVIMELKQLKPELKNQKISYAGRLDPLARGVLLLLVGEEIKHKEKYLSLDKSYEFEAILGIETDTYDLLGLIQSLELKLVPINVNLIVNDFVNKYRGKQLQSYPPYSSKAVDGKHLFWWAKNKRLDEIAVPTREIEIFKFETVGMGEITLLKLEEKINREIALIHGDFRQNSILKRWEEFFAKYDRSEKLKTVKFNVTCSSGTYVRELVHQLGKEIGCGAVTIDILRTTIGDYSLKKSLKL